jgi:tRNA pseudouridine38-40 synthase
MRPLDLPLLEQAATMLRGRHDFRAFSATNGDEPGPADTVRHLRRLDVLGRGRKIRIEAEADGFLYKMMRGLVGALVSAGESRIGLEEMKSILDSRTRTPKILTAPPQGLFLKRVLYR